jgi:hypothetical protein
VLDGELFNTLERFKFGEGEFTSPFLQKIFNVMKKRREDGLGVSPAAVLAILESAEASRFSKLIQKPEALSSGEKAMQDYIEKIRAERLKKNAREDPLAVLQKYRDNSGCGG